MKVTNVVLVLGKRLVNNALTLEGRERVEALSNCLTRFNLEQSVVIFCGGVTKGQTKTEAQAMFDYFLLCHNGKAPTNILIEDTSTNTVENIANAADKLIASQLCQKGQCLEVMFVSHNYHLQRIFEIQALMDEQGLLRSLKTRCSSYGLNLSIAKEVSAHCAVPYPYRGTQAEAFLKLDELTTYRVFLEGAQSGVFQRPLTQVRKLPYEIASVALADLKTLITDAQDRASLNVIQQVLEKTSTTFSLPELSHQLGQYHQHLTQLNRRYDPEQQVAERV